MPLKRDVLPMLDRTTPLVDELGVANTVAFPAGGRPRVLAGANTDVEGIDRPTGGGHSGTCRARQRSSAVGPLRRAPSRLRCGSARSTCGSSSSATPAKAGSLVDLAVRLGVTLEVLPIDSLPGTRHGFLVSTLPGGAADPLELLPSGPDAVLFDVAYEPWPTAAAGRWAAAGGRVLNGLDMLTEQAIGQIRFFVSATTPSCCRTRPRSDGRAARGRAAGDHHRLTISAQRPRRRR